MISDADGEMSVVRVKAPRSSERSIAVSGDQMKLLDLTDAEPRAWEAEGGSGDLRQAKDIAVELPRPLQVGNGDADVVKDRLIARYPQIADAIIHIEPPPPKEF